VQDRADHARGRSDVGRTRNAVAPTSFASQFWKPYWTVDFVHDPRSDYFDLVAPADHCRAGLGRRTQRHWNERWGFSTRAG